MKLPVKYDGLTSKEKKEVREKYIELQEGKCWYCGNKLDQNPTNRIQSMKIDLRLFPRGFLKNKIHLHHNHNSGLTLGSVHARCNAYLWQYEGK